MLSFNIPGFKSNKTSDICCIYMCKNKVKDKHWNERTMHAF